MLHVLYLLCILVCVFYYQHSENGLSGTEGRWAITLTWFFFFSAILSLFIYLYVPVVKYLH